MPVSICLCVFICSCVSVEGVQRMHKVSLVQACQFILSIFTFMFVPEVQRSFHPWKIKSCTKWTLLKVNRATVPISFAKKWYKMKWDKIKYCTKWTLFKATALTPLAKSHTANCTLFLWMPTALLFLFFWMPTALLLNLNTPGILRGPILLPFLPNAFTSLSNLAFCIISLHWQSRDLFAWNAWKQCILYNIQCTQYPWHLKSFCWRDLRHQAGNCQTRETFPRPSCQSLLILRGVKRGLL